MMKKLILPVFALLVSACAGVNKNTVSYQMTKYDTARYYVVAGEGNTKTAAADNALAQMQKELLQHTPQAGQAWVPDLLANAQAQKVWRDKQSTQKHYWALAVLPREKANNVLTPLLDQTDAQLAGLSGQFASPADPLGDLKVAYKMQPLIEKRLALDELYQFVQADRAGYQPETFAPYKNIFKEKMGTVTVGVSVTGTENRILKTYVVDALTQMGLGVVAADAPEQALSVTIETEVDNYGSKKVEGLIWCTSGASVSLADAQKGVTFSQFNVYDRAGTSRLSDSLRRSMQGAGEQAAKQIVLRLENYLKTK